MGLRTPGVRSRRCKKQYTVDQSPDRTERYPPYDDDKIASFRHMRKVFVQVSRRRVFASAVLQ